MTTANNPDKASPQGSESQIQSALAGAHTDAMMRHLRQHAPVAVWLDGRVQTKQVFFAVAGDPFAPPKKAS
jgi:hypothetical protein